MIECPGCGQSLRFDPASQMLVCDYCDNRYQPEAMSAGKTAKGNDTNVETASDSGENHGAQQTFEGKLFTCTQCGGEILSDADTAVTFCSYCGASVELEGRTVTMRAPSYVVPFTKTKEDCKNIYRGFLKKALYAPDYLQEEAELEKLRGIYMPHWIYEFEYQGPSSFSGTKEYRRGDYIITDRYRLDTDLDIYYKGTTFDASSSFSDVYSEAIAPYDIKQCKNFSSAYLSGFYADTADVPASTYRDEAKETAASDATDTLFNSHSEFMTYGVSKNSTHMSANLQIKDVQMAYMPVWFMSHRHKDKVSYTVINGQTGKIAADLPIDYKKFIIGSLILTVPIALILNLLFTFKPTWLIVFAIAFAIVSLIISNNELNQIYSRNNGYDDKGLITKLGIRLPSKSEEDAPVQNKTAKKTLSGFGSSMFTIACVILFFSASAESLAGMGFAIIMGIISFILICLDSKEKSTARKTGVTYSQPFKEKFNVLVKPLAAIILGLLIMIINPYQDSVYYGGMILMLIIVLISFYDVVSLHNQLAMRLPKQFGSRGGDE